jgi:hypothetical protein
VSNFHTGPPIFLRYPRELDVVSHYLVTGRGGLRKTSNKKKSTVSGENQTENLPVPTSNLEITEPLKLYIRVYGVAISILSDY